MKKGKRWLAMSVLILLALLMSGHILANQQQPEDVRYFYQLEPDDTRLNIALYVERSDVSGAPLHSGSIALAAGTGMSFTPAPGWVTTAPSLSQGQPGASEIEEGTTKDGEQYISFSWYWGSIQERPATSEDNPNRQLLGTLTLEGYVPVEEIRLLPWPETNSGADRIAELSSSADREAQLEILGSVWRMPDLTVPESGYYQGFYEAERTDTDTEGGQYQVDLTAGWLGFTIGAYAPEKDAQVLIYRYPEEEGAAPALYAVATADFGEGTGHFKGKIDFSKLDLENPEGSTVTLVGGTYDIEILKPSHVKCELLGVQYDADTEIFPELQGVHMEIPCGDLVMLPDKQRGDDVITLQDRSVLQACLNGSLDQTETEYDHADLNGDGRVSLADLDILMSAENYNKETITLRGKGAGI